MPTPIHAFRYTVCLAAAIGMLLALSRWLARRLTVAQAGLVMVVGLVWFGAFEMFRESVRKPYIITGYIYGNGVEVLLTDRYRREGYLAPMVYRTGDEGADLFRHSCRSCHTIDGYKPLKPAFDGTDRAFIAAITRSAHSLRGNMPPFLGTPAEADKIADSLYRHIDHWPIDVGQRAYEVCCGKCHVVGTANDKSKSFAGLSADDLNGILDAADNLGEGMPDYTGGPAERAALVAYLQTLGKQVKK